MDVDKFRKMLIGSRLENVEIRTNSAYSNSFGGILNGIKEFTVTTGDDKEYLVMSAVNQRNEDKLLEDFKKIMGYDPMIRYTLHCYGCPTYVWERNDPEGRIRKLKEYYPNLVILSKSD